MRDTVAHISSGSSSSEMRSQAFRRYSISSPENAEDKRIEWDVEKEKPLAVEFSGDEMEYLRKA